MRLIYLKKTILSLSVFFLIYDITCELSDVIVLVFFWITSQNITKRLQQLVV